MIVNSITIFILIVYTTLLIYSSKYMIFFCILYVFSFQKRSLFLTFISCFICIFTLYLHYPIYILLLYIDTMVKRSKPTRACSYMREIPQDPPRYEHKSGMIIPRYANTGVLCASGTCLAPTEAERRKDCGSATHGTIRRHHSWGLLPLIDVYELFRTPTIIPEQRSRGR